ncbi:MAG: OmpA family protein [Chitinophagaceae bacterium]|nr:OmpA family protein [Chitinophagaceae bacterium]MCW5905995.1 OmpA family protein [Chitinophagaceae bacterium]
MKKIFLLLTIATITLNASAQVVYDYIKAADAYYQKADYNSAAEYYEKYINSANKKIKTDAFDPYTVNTLTKQQKVAVSNYQQAVYKAAECYRHLNYHVKAEPYYAQATKFDSTQFPLAYYWHGKTLRALANYDAAETALTTFISQGQGGSDYIDDANREIKNLKFIKAQLAKNDLHLYKVNKSGGINTPGANYAPSKVNDNTYLFTSTRPDSGSAKNDVYTNRIYTATYSDGVLNEVKKTVIPQPAYTHQGVVSVTPNGNIMYLTRWTIAGAKKSAAIYSSKKANNGWGEPTLLDSTINVSGANTQQPFVMPDGRALLFSSDRSGGVGGFDLWYVQLDKEGNVISGTVSNMGSNINTKFDEQAPYYHTPSGTLVFSSNGYVGMGGYDFYASKGTVNNWSAPENLGYPLNSIKDDIYFSSNGGAKNILGDVMFSSDRESACCLDMFTLSKERPIKQIAGIVVDCETNEPINGANVEVKGSSYNTVASSTTGSDGSYSFTIEDFDNFTSSASAEGYNANSVTTAGITDDMIVNQTLNVLCLQKIPPPPPETPPAVDTVVVMDNIYFAFNKADLLPESHAALDEQIVSMMNKYPTMVIEIGGHTDSQGSDDYNLTLSKARAESVKKYLVGKGIEASRMEAVGYGESKPIAPNSINGKDNPEGRKKNRRTEFKVLHY